MEEQSLIANLNNEMGIHLPEQLSFEDMRLQLQHSIAAMIATDFERLVNILYRIDVNERKLKYLLQENVGADAAVIIADLVIERQMQKMASRRQYSRNNEENSGEEKW